MDYVPYDALEPAEKEFFASFLQKYGEPALFKIAHDICRLQNKRREAEYRQRITDAAQARAQLLPVDEEDALAALRSRGLLNSVDYEGRHHEDASWKMRHIDFEPCFMEHFLAESIIPFDDKLPNPIRFKDEAAGTLAITGGGGIYYSFLTEKGVRLLVKRATTYAYARVIKTEGKRAKRYVCQVTWNIIAPDAILPALPAQPQPE